jgi:hypothetical protein
LQHDAASNPVIGPHFMLPEERDRYQPVVRGTALISHEDDRRHLVLVEPPHAVELTTPLGTRLRLERERRRITLASISASTKINIGLLQGLERNDVSRWPTGIFRRAFIRAYADAIGLDGDRITQEFLAMFPDPREPGFEAALPPLSRQQLSPHSDAGLRLTFAEPMAANDPPLSTRLRQRGIAAVADLAVLLLLGLMLLVLSGELWKPWAVVILGYYAVGTALFGKTPAATVLGAEWHRVGHLVTELMRGTRISRS